MPDWIHEPAEIAHHCILDTGGNCSQRCCHCKEQELAIDDFLVTANGIVRASFGIRLSQTLRARILTAIDRLRKHVIDQ